MIDNTINGAVTIAGGEGTFLANRYRIVRQLGRGGMGNVWLVEDTQLDNKQFAVKMLPAILVANKRAYRQLKDEALVAMRLVHPNIVQIRAFEGNDGNPFLVMDYVDGQTLDDYLAEHTGTTGVSPVAGGLSEAEVLRILRPIADALDYAHGEGVVHRDVKPANVMIRKDGHPFILDFGIAREIQETMTRVTGKLSSGTLLYMSPEQLNGELPKPAQDVYSFAAMVYECLKGEPPFVRGQVEHQILNNPPEPLLGGTQLAASVMAGLAKKPKDRPANCSAVLRGSSAPAASVGTANGSGKSAASPRPQQPERSRSRATVAILVAALLVMLGGAWWAIIRTDVSPVQETLAPSPTGSSPVRSDDEANWMRFVADSNTYVQAENQFKECTREAQGVRNGTAVVSVDAALAERCQADFTEPLAHVVNGGLAQTNTESSVVANRIITDDDWENVKKSLKFAGKIRQNGRLMVVINGKVYAEGDLVSVTHDETRFTWRVEGLNDAKLRLVRIRAQHLFLQ